ncbi:MAG: T9SS type A sorting domain-containing protein [candidate division KSB1 bacterium]|nr:T9SS type A sorting domain-containing protein [candidate division KSB1 bacterium]
MKKVFYTVVALLMVSSLALAQWEYVGDFATIAQPHGIVKTGDGKIWVGSYAYTDTIFKPDGTPIRIKPIWVYNQDGSVYAKVRFLKHATGQIDTLYNGCRGDALDNEGNIFHSAYDEMWRINYQTLDPATFSAEVTGKVKPKPAASLTEGAADENGYVYLAHVASGNPAYIFDKDLQLYSFVADTNLGLQRSVLVSKDGKDVYFGKIYSGRNGVVHWHSDDGPDGTYAPVDTFGTTPDKVMWGQCLDWDPWGMMWVGTYWDVGANDFTGWYALDPKKGWAIVDSIGKSKGKFDANVPADGGTFYSPRGVILWEEGGVWYALTNDFDGGLVKKWKNANPYTGVIRVENGEVVRNYSLLQNYPNPFNPTTTIPFTLAKRGFVELKIYDINGREVKTLVSQNMEEGRYDIPFDATGLPTGTYFYRLKVDGQLMTKSMTLVK